MLRLDLHQALSALHRYNRPKVLELDAEANRFFSDGLGVDPDSVKSQIDFVLHRYGGASSLAPSGLVSEIAAAVLGRRGEWLPFLEEAQEFHFDRLDDWRFSVPTLSQFECFGTLRKVGNAVQMRCLTKFLHLLRPKAFIIQDCWIGAALGVEIGHDGNRTAYSDFATRFLEFGRLHVAIIPQVKAHDNPPSWSDIKLIDKILLCRRVAELGVAA